MAKKLSVLIFSLRWSTDLLGWGGLSSSAGASAWFGLHCQEGPWVDGSRIWRKRRKRPPGVKMPKCTLRCRLQEWRPLWRLSQRPLRLLHQMRCPPKLPWRLHLRLLWWQPNVWRWRRAWVQIATTWPPSLAQQWMSTLLETSWHSQLQLLPVRPCLKHNLSLWNQCAFLFLWVCRSLCWSIRLCWVIETWFISTPLSCQQGWAKGRNNKGSMAPLEWNFLWSHGVKCKGKVPLKKVALLYVCLPFLKHVIVAVMNLLGRHNWSVIQLEGTSNNSLALSDPHRGYFIHNL